MCRCVLLFLVIADLHQLYAQESAQYLQNAIRDLRNLHGYQQTITVTDNIISDEIIPEQTDIEQYAEKRIQTSAVPPLGLTKGELAAIYNAALSKGDTVNLKTSDNSYIQAAVHEIDEKLTEVDKSNKNNEVDDKGDTAGYYYYYFPIKSFLDEMTSQSSRPNKQYTSPPPPPTNNYDYREDPDKTQFQYHSHMHHHNIKIVNDLATEKKTKKGLEPLFVAISGFIGVAVMFILSVLVLPKFGIKKPIIKKNERISDIARVALQAIEGKDCTERFACELEKTARTFHVQDNRFVKLLKRLAPSFGKQMDKAGRYGVKKLRCTAIPCKNKNNNNNNNNNNNKNNQNKKKAKITAQKKH